MRFAASSSSLSEPLASDARVGQHGLASGLRRGVVPSADRRTPRIPDSDRYWLSFGAGYDLTESMTIDAAYTHIFSPDAHMNQQVADTGNAARGNLSGTFQSSADIVNASLSMKF